MTFVLLALSARAEDVAEPAAAPPFSVESEPIVVLSVDKSRDLVLRMRVARNHNLYADTVEIEVTDAAGLDVGAPTHPLGDTTKDPAGTEERELLSDRSDLRLPLKAPAALAGTTVQLGVTVHYQGCRAGTCFAPMHTDLVVPVKVTGKKK